MSSDNQLQEEVFELNGKRFYRTSYFDIVCIRSEDDYYNFTKIAQDNGYKDIAQLTRLKYWREYIDEFKRTHKFAIDLKTIISVTTLHLVQGGEFIEITNENLTFTIVNQEGERSCLNGTYYPKKLLHFFCEHVNKAYAMKIADLISLIEEETKLRTITLEEKTNEQAKLVDSLKQENETLKTRLINCNLGFNHEQPGTILMIRKRTDDEANNLIRIRFSQLTQSNYEANRRNGRDVIETKLLSNIYNPLEIQRLFNHYARFNMLNDLTYVSRNYVTGSFEAIEKAISVISNFELSSTTFTKNDALQVCISFALKAKIPRHQIRSKLFEYFCAYKYGFKPFNREVTEAVGLCKRDVAMDLIDIKNKRIGQCKYYKSKLPYSRLDTYLDSIDSLQAYNAYLYVNDNCEVDEEIEGEVSWTLIRVPNSEFEEFLKSVDEQLPKKSLSNEVSEAEISLLKSIIGVSQMDRDELLSKFNELNKSNWSIVQFYNSFEDSLKFKHESFVDDYNRLELNHDKEFIEILRSWFDEYISSHQVSIGLMVADELLNSFNSSLHRFETMKTLTKRLHECNYEFEAVTKSVNGSCRTCIQLKIEVDEHREFIRETLQGRCMLKHELINLFNSKFDTDYKSNKFTRDFIDMFECDPKHQLKHIKIDGKTVHVYALKRDIEIEKAFIREYLKSGYKPRDELLNAFNSHFQSDYNSTSFTTRFRDMFVFTSPGKLKRITISKGRSVPVCMLL